MDRAKILAALRLWWAETMAAGDLMDAYRVDYDYWRVIGKPVRGKGASRAKQRARTTAADWAYQKLDREGYWDD